ncbi:MAG: glycosyltransferase family 4 protein [Chloroflexi bacterium]|nr:glycosyltransferase family 4 protein [Chloroflexota bacterium]
MAHSNSKLSGINIGFISTRFAGEDGVSLETEKWAHVLEGLGHKCFYFAGDTDKPPEVSRVVPEAFFLHPEIRRINEVVFRSRTRPPEITQSIHRIRDHLKQEIDAFVQQHDLQLLIAENALSIPMHIPLGLALTEYIAETGFPTVGHHHDFFWERKRFLVNCVWDYLNMAFPPHLPNIHHVVINSSGANQLSLRTGISSLLIPNVMDFDHPPPRRDEYGAALRSDLGVNPDEKLILQPTRVVQRKGIEHSIELVSRLNGEGLQTCLVISHASGDEGYEYERYLRHRAENAGVKALFIAEIIQEKRGLTADGRKIYTLADVYHQADLVTYPSDIEGFGNAFLEAVYYRRPVVVNNYSIFDIDIKPKGFQVIEFEGFIGDATIDLARKVLENPAMAGEMLENNYRIARRHYSYAVLKRHLETLLAEIFGE